MPLSSPGPLHRSFFTVLCLTCLGLLSGCGDSSVPTSTASPTVQGQVTVSGTQLLRNGVVWAPHGLVMIAFVAPPTAQSGVFLTASQNYSPGEFAAMKTWGADTVRMQVSQPGLDPNNPLSLQNPGYLTSVQNAVAAARSAGLNVIVSVTDETQSGETTTQVPYPDSATQRVWGILAPLFKADTGILFEMLNEPTPAANAADYATWATDMNAVISIIRAAGSKNVVVADGLNFALQLGGAPFLTDSANEVAYAEHPYFHSMADQTQPVFDTRFGNFAATAPVIVTEWTSVANASMTGSTYYCDSNTATASVTLMQYLQTKGIGITAYAWDFSGPFFGSAVYGIPAFNTSSFANNAQCGSSGYGPGKTLQTWYQTGVVPMSPQ